ncbi:molybdenum ABC transporter permease, partial [Kurthia sp. Dielmo]|uniref:molybdate ABC transporter permease subunit n=1 Tax=Kurthia sp. Dielmo TaxID=1033738 RepID=UPI00112286CF
MLTDFWTPIKLSIEISLVAGTMAIILGILIGKFMAKRRFRGKLILETVMLLPLVLPPTVVGFLLIMIFGRNSIVGQGIEWFFGQPIMFTWWAAVLASAIVAFPLMYQTVKTGFEGVDEDIENA